MDVDAILERELRACAVQLRCGNVNGSGFFVAPRLALTCAHVVGGAGDGLTVTWNGRRYDARVLFASRPGASGEASLWPYPDLAAVEVDIPEVHPCVSLADDFETTTGRIDRPLLCVGYTAVYSRQPRLSAVTFVTGGFQEVDGGELLRLKDDEISEGLSGAPLLDRRTGMVCGVVKTTRENDVRSGAWPSRCGPCGSCQPRCGAGSGGSTTATIPAGATGAACRTSCGRGRARARARVR